MAKKPCVNTSIGTSCDDPLFVQMCAAVGIETALTEVGCIFDPADDSVIIGKALACKTTDEATGVDTFKIVAVYEDGTVDQDYTGAWGECNPLTPSTLLLEGCIPDVANPGETELGVVGINGADGSLLWGPFPTSIYGFVSCCPEDDLLEACVIMEGFDYYGIGDYSANDTTVFDVLIDGVSVGTVALDYTVETDGVNKSSWYAQLVALVNAQTGWSMAVNADAGETTSQRPLWLMEYAGAGASTLAIAVNNDLYTMAVDAAGVMTSDATDGGNPMGTGKFTPCA